MPSRALLITASIRQACATTTTNTQHRYHHTVHSGPKYPTHPLQSDNTTATSAISSPSTADLPTTTSPSNRTSFHLASTSRYRPRSSPPMTPANPALSRMISSNVQWAEDVKKHEPDFFRKSAEGQSPQLLWIGCADSRVPESVVMGAKPGDIFVHRNIANQFHLTDDSAQSVLAYAVNNLKVLNVAVVGHTCCGGAAACLQASTSPSAEISPDSPLGRWLGPMTSLARDLNVGNEAEAEMDAERKHAILRELIEENVKVQVANIIKTDTILEAWKSGKKVFVHGWIYEIEEGIIRDLNITIGPDTLGAF